MTIYNVVIIDKESDKNCCVKSFDKHSKALDYFVSYVLDNYKRGFSEDVVGGTANYCIKNERFATDTTDMYMLVSEL